jgi:hypothetical protein
MRFLAPPHQWFLKLAFLKTELWVYSRSCDSLFDGTTTYSGNDWLTESNMRQDGFVIMDCGSAIAVKKFVLYNQNEYADSHRDVKEVAVYYSDTGVVFTHLKSGLRATYHKQKKENLGALIGTGSACGYTKNISVFPWGFVLQALLSSSFQPLLVAGARGPGWCSPGSWPHRGRPRRTALYQLSRLLWANAFAV